ncbi:hypothetical protein VM98_37290, partial [Streptomyces rubellomurinus subsp. indigoferus]
PLQGLIDLTHELARLLREDVVVRAGVRLGRRAVRRDGPDSPPAPDAPPRTAAPPRTSARPGTAATWRGLAAVVHRLLARAEAAGVRCPGLARPTRGLPCKSGAGTAW